MGSKGGFILFLLVLAVLCHSDHSLTCSICTEPEHDCNKTTTCSVNLDVCLFVKAEPKLLYHQCWKFNNQNYKYISKALGLKKLEYRCCPQDLCNRNAGASVSGKMALLATPLLAVA
ncbi:CD59 glycoprotein-like [Lutra lutra]|uniref:CD59 glycoprotein-like n=1 Tax=Lutra lutra TaxID=9657 RepID=UPI001FD3B8A7|nr:CD59 glycoprotein-like [Lutra lutra]